MMSHINSIFEEFSVCSLQDFPVEKLLKMFNVNDCLSCLEKVKKIPELYNALAFIFSIHHLVNNLPNELPDDVICDDVKKTICSQGLPYELDNDKLEDGLKKYFGYSLPHRKNGNRDIVYTRIREAGYAHLRFAQEICKKVVDENKWNKIVANVQLASAYGDDDEINEIRGFFSNLTQSNFTDSFIEKGYSKRFADNLEKRFRSKNKNKSAWELLEADIEVECVDGELYFKMPSKMHFPDEGTDYIDFIFELNDDEEMGCCYQKSLDNEDEYERFHMDNIPVAKCKNITRNRKNIFPAFLEGCFVIWDMTKKTCLKKLKYPAKLNIGQEYIIFPTVLFDSSKHTVREYNEETQECKAVELPYEITGKENVTVIITCDQEYEISFSDGTSLLNYDKILPFSPDRRKYRYFSEDDHPFTDISVSDDDKIKISCDGQEETFCLAEWCIPDNFLCKKCTLTHLGKNKSFQNIVFFSREQQCDLKKLCKKHYPVSKEVQVEYDGQTFIFPPGATRVDLEVENNPVKLEIMRKGAVLDLGNSSFFLEKDNQLDMQDFVSATLKYFHKEKHTIAKTLATVRKNGLNLNYIAPHKVSYPCTNIGLLNIKRSYADMNLFTEPEFSLKLFLYDSEISDSVRYNRGCVCPLYRLSEYIRCGGKKSISHDYNLKFELSDYTLDRVRVEANKVSHKISYTISQEKNRYIFCLPVEKQNGEFVEIDISNDASLEGDNPLQQTESVTIENIFTGKLKDSYGVLAFFVYEQNGKIKRYSPGFFLKNPADICTDNFSNLQKALCSCDANELDRVFSEPGNSDFIETVFENGDKIVATHFFNCFFNNSRSNGRYINTSSFVFRAADYWIPAALKKDENGNYTQAQRRLAEHWDFELFGYEETKRYLPELTKKELINILKKDNFGLVQGSLFYSLDDCDISILYKNLYYKELSSVFKLDDMRFKSKIMFLKQLFPKPEGASVGLDGSPNILIFEEFEEKVFIFDLAFAIDELARRIHLWKKNPCLSEIYLNSDDRSKWDRKNGDDKYYYTEQYLRGELIYWRNMAAFEPEFKVLRKILLCRIAQYAEKDGINYNI